jgi:hypothetical protein
LVVCNEGVVFRYKGEEEEEIGEERVDGQVIY